MLIIGLTGSLAMGKSTIARFFMDEGIPVHDSDACVHSLYKLEAVPPIRDLNPTLVTDGVVDRAALAKQVAMDTFFLKKLEAIVHPLVEQKRVEFLKKAEKQGHSMVVLDVPLLFEIGLSKQGELIVVASTDVETQKERALRRPGMTLEKFHLLLSRQAPNLEKTKLAHWVIDTSFGFELAKSDVKSFINAFRI